MGENVNAFIAFIGGILSFASPCVLPLIPGYISYITGMSIDALTESADKSFFRKVFLNSLLFVIGFSTIFILLGAGASSLSRFLTSHMRLFNRIAGAIVVIFGLHLTGIITIPFLLRERRVQVDARGRGLLGSYFMGFLFGFGWTPCVGPILASILFLAAQQETMWRGIFLLTWYSAGLGIPFILSAMFINSFFAFFEGVKKHLRKVEIASGVLLLAVGALMFFNKIAWLSRIFSFVGFRG